MATTSKAAAAAVLLLLVAAAAVVPASASTLTAFSGPGCAGRTKDVNGCGCFDISGYHGGFHFVFTEGQDATLYTGSYCDGNSVSLYKETRRCERNKFKSIYMVC
ncbi:unnamed protein product [Spirodela intermedia]|uniref:Uncharacterized protein n=2 Tax=Spirodela intermedia TaxID=51605 RepID=A0A7I8KAD5_SPIIN|nr:unnamed protein product [Spirodela intermedia]CAA6674551.1 unnamed protein product [Spirodela intermedia]CAA6674765.1 unnamed protein product [Spirodela intermedia]CAA7394256.1 unnamed protein product [Spirodela intermedia]CAA7394262.1 unnamed protein product [Spirodela intermedia]